MTLRIRHATPEDAAGIATIYRSIVLETSISFELEPPDAAEMAERMERIQATHLWLVGEDDAGALAGYAYASPFRARAAYARSCETTVYVAASHRRQGAGRALMEALLDEVRARGFHLAIAGVTLPNEGSVRLHEALGFEAVGTFQEVGHKFDMWHDVGFWQLRLEPGAPPR